MRNLNWPRPRGWWRGMQIAGTVVAALAIITAACSTTVTRPAGPSQTTGTSAAVQPARPPTLPVVKPPAVTQPGPVAFVPAEKRTPAQWMEYLGIRLVEERDSSGPPAFTPKDGDVYYFSNESTTWGATNTRNNVAIIDANKKTVVARSDLPEEYSLNYSSHSVAVSQDGNWAYLGAIGGERNFTLILNAHTLKLAKVYETLGRSHHINNLTLPDGRDVVMAVDFNWNWASSGIYGFDPSNENQIVGGLGRGDFSGNPYIASGDVNGFMYVTDVWGVVYKIDVRSGTSAPIVWKMDPGQQRPDRNRGVALWGNLVISVTGYDGRIIATDAETGRIV